MRTEDTGRGHVKTGQGQQGSHKPAGNHRNYRRQEGPPQDPERAGDSMMP